MLFEHQLLHPGLEKRVQCEEPHFDEWHNCIYLLLYGGLCVLPGFGVFLGFLVGCGFGIEVLLDDPPEVLVGPPIIIVVVGEAVPVAISVSSELTGRRGISAMR